MDEAHCSRYSIHPKTNKMYQDLKKNLWWTRMKREITRYVSECDTCWRVKADHLRLAGNLQPLSIPEWKWENICMDFIMSLPRTSHGYNSIWVIVDCLTKSLTLYPYPPPTKSDNMLSSTCHTLSIIMVSQRPLSLTEGLSLRHDFGNNYMTVWALISSEVQPIIPRWTGKLNESIKSSRICSVLVLWAMGQNGTNISHSLSSPITIVKLVRVRRMGYIWSWHCDRGRRECKINLCKHPDCPIPSEKLHRQKAPSLGVWCGKSRIPLSLPNERCTSLQHQRKDSSSLHRSVSHHRQVWADVLSSGATVKAVGST
jgi:hypothetical protein